MPKCVLARTNVQPTAYSNVTHTRVPLSANIVTAHTKDKTRQEETAIWNQRATYEIWRILDLHRAYRFPGHVPIGIEGLIPISFPLRAKAKVLDAMMMPQS